MYATEMQLPSKAKGRKNRKYEKRTLNHYHTIKTTDCGTEKDSGKENSLKMSDQSQIPHKSMCDILIRSMK